MEVLTAQQARELIADSRLISIYRRIRGIAINGGFCARIYHITEMAFTSLRENGYRIFVSEDGTELFEYDPELMVSDKEFIVSWEEF